MNPYLSIFQVVMAIYTVMGIGFVSAYLKMFGMDDASIVRKIDYLICLPGMFFRRIGLKRLNYHDWKPFIIEVLIQASIHIIFLIGVLFHSPSARPKKYLEMLFSNCYVNLIITGYPFVRAVYGDEFLYIPVFANIVTTFILVPLHTLLIYPIPKEEHETEERYVEEEEDELEDGIEVGGGSVYNVSELEKLKKEDSKLKVDDHGNPQLSSTDSKEIMKENENKLSKNTSEEEDSNEEEEINIQIDSHGNPHKLISKKSKKDKKKKDKKKKNDDKEKEKDDKKDTNEKDEKKKKAPNTWWKAFLWALCTPSNVCIILGIIWSATRLKMVIFLDSTSGYLEKAVMGAGLFAIGIFMWEHPFKECPWKFVSINLIFRFIIIPLIAALWSWVLKADKVVSQIMVFIHSMPSALIGYAMTLNAGFGMKTSSFTFYWTNILFLPALFLWCVVIREAGLFKSDDPGSI